ncbi:hypothetical protein L3Q82_003159 [Scortum barcoo]|uniref:Uncharacterized protein n=1 Tax=Scortum barcoo TaxID=214431 RepID=A0ACB8VR46_9TELE|nr:hypothetical protein L3Q82_003159 [Scortum barcoo]
MMFWRKDGEEIHEDVDHGEILPNHDGSFQMSVDLKLSSVTPEDWSRYDCVFHLSGVKDDDIVTNWTGQSRDQNKLGLLNDFECGIFLHLFWDGGIIVMDNTLASRGDTKLAMTLDPLTLTPDPWTLFPRHAFLCPPCHGNTLLAAATTRFWFPKKTPARASVRGLEFDSGAV